MALNWVDTKMITDNNGVVYEAAMLQNGNVGFGVRQKDDYWLASVLDREQVVHPDDVKLAQSGWQRSRGGMNCTWINRRRGVYWIG